MGIQEIIGILVFLAVCILAVDDVWMGVTMSNKDEEGLFVLGLTAQFIAFVIGAIAGFGMRL